MISNSWRIFLPLLTLLFLPTKNSWAQSDNFNNILRSGEVIDITPIANVHPSWYNYLYSRYYIGYKPGRNFYISTPKVGIQLSYEYEDEVHESPGIKTTDKYNKFAERIGFSSSGWVYHPNFCRFDVSFEPEFTQSYEEDTAGNTENANLISPDYSLTARFFDPKKYSFRLHASRREVPSWSAYQGGLESLINKYSGEFEVKNYMFMENKFQAIVGYMKLENSFDGFYNSDGIHDEYYVFIRQGGSNLTSQIDINYTDSSKTFNNFDESNTELFQVQFDSQYDFKKNNLSLLNNRLDYQRQDFGTITTESLRYFGDINVTHSDKLHSYYSLRFINQGSNGNNGNNISINGWLRHQLFNNLSTTAGTNLLYYDYPTGQNTGANPYLRLRYSRNLPFGHLQLKSGWNYRFLDRKYENSPRQNTSVLNEQHILRFGEETYLDNSNVDASTIIVTNTKGDIRYFEDIDYIIEHRDEFIVISRTPFGDISEGQTVRVNYMYQRDADFTDGIFHQNYSAGLSLFQNWTFFVSHARFDQNVISGEEPSTLLNGSSSTARIRYNLGWSDTDFKVGQYDRSSSINYSDWRIEQRFHFKPLRGLNFSGHLYYTERYYDNENDRIYYGGGVTTRWRIIKGLNFSLYGYASNSEVNENTTTNTGIQAKLEYKYRIWTARLQYELSDQNDDRTDTSRIRHLIRFDIIRIKW